MKSVVRRMMNCFLEERKHQAVYKKYASQKFLRCSLFVDDWIENRPEEVLDLGIEWE